MFLDSVWFCASVAAVTVQESRRERKKRRTREAIVAAAFTLFAERGFEAVTVTEIAELADVARATLFSYFPTKESIALGAVGDDDPADIVASRPPELTPLDALRRHYRAFAVGGVTDAVTGPADGGPGDGGPPGPDLLTCVRVIAESPALTAGAGRLLDGQRAKLAGVLAAEAGEVGLWPELAAAQICAVISVVKSGFLEPAGRGRALRAGGRAAAWRGRARVRPAGARPRRRVAAGGCPAGPMTNGGTTVRCKGITYDTGFFPAGRNSRPNFEPEQVRRDMAVIAGELRCDAVRITGGDLDRLTVAARHAAAAGLEVWFSPLPCELDPEPTLRLLDAAAGRAQELRDAAGAEVVLVLGGELSVFGSGFVPGADSDARLASLLAPPPELLAG